MKTIIVAVTFVTLAVSTLVFASDEDEIIDVIARMDAALNTNNLDGFLELFANNAVEMPNDEPALVGLEAIRIRDGNFFANYTDQISQNVEDVSIDGDLAVLRLNYHEEVTPKAGGSKVVYDGKGVVVLERQSDGQWKISMNIWNLDQPM